MFTLKQRSCTHQCSIKAFVKLLPYSSEVTGRPSFDSAVRVHRLFTLQQKPTHTYHASFNRRQWLQIPVNCSSQIMFKFNKRSNTNSTSFRAQQSAVRRKVWSCSLFFYSPHGTFHSLTCEQVTRCWVRVEESKQASTFSTPALSSM